MSRTRRDLVGSKFGRLEVKEFSGKSDSGSSYWNCLCDCGTVKRVQGSNLTSGATVSCGCFKVEQTKKANTKHGHRIGGKKTRLYILHDNIMQRCYNPEHPFYSDYGGRGIRVCERWHEFENFRIDIGEPPKGMTFDRENNEGDYEPNNYRWITMKDQCSNRRSNIWLTLRGEIKTISQWSTQLGIKPATLAYRHHSGWSDERVLTTPVMTYS